MSDRQAQGRQPNRTRGDGETIGHLGEIALACPQSGTEFPGEQPEDGHYAAQQHDGKGQRGCELDREEGRHAGIELAIARSEHAAGEQSVAEQEGDDDMGEMQAKADPSCRSEGKAETSDGDHKRQVIGQFALKHIDEGTDGR